MEKFVPYEKLSKKARRELDRAKRRTWGVLNPTSRLTPNGKAYDRNRSRNWKQGYPESDSGIPFPKEPVFSSKKGLPQFGCSSPFLFCGLFFKNAQTSPPVCGRSGTQVIPAPAGLPAAAYGWRFPGGNASHIFRSQCILLRRWHFSGGWCISDNP